MDGWVRVLRPFNSISVISRRWKGEHEKLCAMKRRLGSGRISPPAGFEPATPSSEVGSANRSATRTLQVTKWKSIQPKIKVGYRIFVSELRKSITVFCTRYSASAFRKLLSIYVFSYFPYDFEGRMWDLIVSVPDHCLSFYFALKNRDSCTWIYQYTPFELKKSCTDNFEAMKFYLLFKIFSWQNYHQLPQFRTYRVFRWGVMTCLCKTCMFQTCMFLC